MRDKIFKWLDKRAISIFWGKLKALVNRRALHLLGVGGAFTFFAPFVAFWFWRPEQGLWPDRPPSMGTIGDFFGGITNPLLSFMAFIGVLWTLKEQREGAQAVARAQAIQAFPEVHKNTKHWVNDSSQKIH
ncbi:MAG: hypothetical protein RRB13_07485 [bacterium]|nr:hypothetical protein [bacterium]